MSFVLTKFFLFTIALFIVPLAAFFGTQHFMYSLMYTEKFFVNCISVVAAVFAVNIIIGLYAFNALQETDETKSTEQVGGTESVTEDNKKDD